MRKGPISWRSLDGRSVLARHDDGHAFLAADARDVETNANSAIIQLTILASWATHTRKRSHR